MNAPRAEVVVERMTLLSAQLTALFDRIDAHDRVGAELRTEAAATAHELGALRRELERDLNRRRVLRYLDSSEKCCRRHGK